MKCAGCQKAFKSMKSYLNKIVSDDGVEGQGDARRRRNRISN
jgi:hypothetical protein